MNGNTYPTCKDRIANAYTSTIEDLKTLWNLYTNEGPEAYDDELGKLDEHGLAFDYVAPGTFTDQAEGFFRYQLSTGGPGDEFRVYADMIREYDWSIYRIEYWYLDWSDGASVTLQGEDLELVTEIMLYYFMEAGIFDHAYHEATTD